MALGSFLFAWRLRYGLADGETCTDALDPGAYAIAINGFELYMAVVGQCVQGARAQLLGHEGKPADCLTRKTLFLLVACNVSDIFVNPNGFAGGLAGVLCNLLLPYESLSLRYVLSNSHDSGCFIPIKNKWACNCRNAMTVLKNI